MFIAGLESFRRWSVDSFSANYSVMLIKRRFRNRYRLSLPFVMDFAAKIVGRLPLEELWNEHDILRLDRGRSLSEREIVDLLRTVRPHFVVADVGETLRWVEPDDCYQFWKTEVKPHLAKPNSHFQLEDFPGQYCFAASDWGVLNAVPIIVLERFH
jgi:hypothetical protein